MLLLLVLLITKDDDEDGDNDDDDDDDHDDDDNENNSKINNSIDIYPQPWIYKLNKENYDLQKPHTSKLCRRPRARGTR